MLEIIMFSTVLLALGIASWSDLKTREVPDWLSYATIFFGIGTRLLFSVILNDWSYTIHGLIGGGVFLIVALLMFYTGQWGGGDSKLLIGIGTMIGLNPELTGIPILLIFWFNTLFIGAFYGLVYSFFLAFKHRKKFVKQFKKIYMKYKMYRHVFIVLSLVAVLTSLIIGDYYLKLTILVFALMFFLMIYVMIFIKAVEEAAMKKMISIEKLTEGDWIVKEVIVDGKRICGPKDLGIDKKQIKKLLSLKKQGKISKIMVKEGIPFIPGFFFAMIATILFSKWYYFFYRLF